MIKFRILKTLNFMFAFICTRLSKPGKTWFNQFWVCFCFYLTLFLLPDGNISGKLGSYVNCLKWLFRLYSVSNGMKLFVVRNKHLFMMIKIVFHSLHFFSLYVIVTVIAQNIPVQFFEVIMQHHFALCMHLGLFLHWRGAVPASRNEEEVEDQTFSCLLGKKT